MKRLVKWLKLTALVAAIAALADQDIHARDGNGALHVQGDAAAVRLELHSTTIADALAALSSTFNVSFRSAIALDEVRDGTYQGSLRRVIAQVLDGYSYVIKYDKSQLDVLVFEPVGKRAAAAPQQHPASSERRPVAGRHSRDLLFGTQHVRCLSTDGPDSDCARGAE